MNDMSMERLEALHRQLDGSMSTLAVMDKGEIKRTPAGDIISEGAVAWTVYSDKGTNVLMSKYDSGAAWPKHEHTDSVEFLICVTGEFQITTHLASGDLLVVLSAGECIRIPPKVIHSAICPSGGALLAICVPPEKAY